MSSAQPGNVKIETETVNYLNELDDERSKLRDIGDGIPHTTQLLDKEMQRIRSGGSKDEGAGGFQGKAKTPLIEIHKDRPVRVQARVIIPVKEHPHFNFVGKLLGPKGNSLKQLQAETQTGMVIMGRGCMWDKAKEEDLRRQGDPKYAHLNEDLHIEITAYAPAPEAYSRISHALCEVKKFLVPDYYDEIYPKQLEELAVLGGKRTAGPESHSIGMSSMPEGSGSWSAGNRPPPPAGRSMSGTMGRFGPVGNPPGPRPPGIRSFFPPGPPPPGGQRRPVPPRPGRPPSGNSASTTSVPRTTPGYRGLGTESESYASMDRAEDDAYHGTGEEQYAATGETDYADYGDTYEEGYADNGYTEESYGGDDWSLATGGSADRMKAPPPSRGMSRSTYRGHPYASFGTPSF